MQYIADELAIHAWIPALKQQRFALFIANPKRASGSWLRIDTSELGDQAGATSQFRHTHRRCAFPHAVLNDNPRL